MRQSYTQGIVRAFAIALLAVTIVGFGTVAMAQDRASPERFFLIGSGGIKGIYFPIASDICQSVNRTARRHGWRCGVTATDGTDDNVNAMKDGRLTFAIVQSNVLQKLNGSDASVPFPTVAALYPEPVHIAVRADSPVHSIQEFAGLAVSIGQELSGSRQVGLALLSAVGLEPSDVLLRSVDPSTQARLLCEGDLEAVIWVSGIRNSSMTEVHRLCAVRLLGPSEQVIDKVRADIPGLVQVSIPADTYRGQTDPIPSFGPIARIVTPASTSSDLVSLVIEAIAGRLGDIRPTHPALADPTQASFVNLFPQEVFHPAAAAIWSVER